MHSRIYVYTLLDVYFREVLYVIEVYRKFKAFGTNTNTTPCFALNVWLKNRRCASSGKSMSKMCVS